MTDGVICDRCGAAVRSKKWHRQLRAEGWHGSTTSAATRDDHEDFQLCSRCTEQLQDFLDGASVVSTVTMSVGSDDPVKMELPGVCMSVEDGGEDGDQ